MVIKFRFFDSEFINDNILSLASEIEEESYSFLYLQLRIDLVWYDHSIAFQEEYCVSQRLKHLVCGCLSVSDSQQVTHNFHQATMVSFTHRPG